MSAGSRDGSAEPLVSVIVPCRNEEAYIAECLNSIRANDYAAERFEVLVVDGVSDDGTRNVLEQYARRWPCMRLLDNPARTTPAAFNIGIQQCRGEIVMIMGAHCRYPKNYISALVRWLERSGADNVGGTCRTLPGSETSIARAIALALSHPFGVGNSHFRIGTSRARWVDTVPFGCYRRDVFERIGLFDEDLVRNQDDEHNLRLLKAGGRILLVPDVVSEYYARDSLRKVARMYYQYGYFKPLVVRKLGRVGTVRQLVPAAFLILLATSLLLSPWITVALWTFAGILGVYLAASLFATVHSSGQRGPTVSAFLFATFLVIHFSYAVGSLRGIKDFLVLRRSAVSSRIAIPVSR